LEQLINLSYVVNPTLYSKVPHEFEKDFNPVGTPKQIIAFLHREIVDITALPDIRERLAVLGFDPVASTPQEFVQHAKVEFAKWAKVIHASHIKAQ
jgi:tripartite-type tricarboxylate transporter receptor subunit TctC